MQFVDDQLTGRKLQGLVTFPVVVLPDKLPAVDAVVGGAGALSPEGPAGDRPGVGIQQDPGGIEAQAVFRVPGTVKPVPVFRILDVDPEDHDRVNISDAEFLGQEDFGKGVLFSAMVQHEGASRGFLGENAEIDGPLLGDGCAEGEHASDAVLKAACPVGREGINQLHGVFPSFLLRPASSLTQPGKNPHVP